MVSGESHSDKGKGRPSIAIVIPSFRRPDCIRRQLAFWQNIDSRSLPLKVAVFLVDDSVSRTSTESWLSDTEEMRFRVPLFALIRSRNLGQGPNVMDALARLWNFDYLWVLADDDFLIEESMMSLLEEVRAQEPAVAVCEFRQGLNLERGTFFNGDVRILGADEVGLEAILRFGKGSNVILRNPGPSTIVDVAIGFHGSMYEDKALALSVVSKFESPKILVFPRITVVADSNFGRLRYPMRVFANLERVVDKLSHEQFLQCLSSSMWKRSRLNEWEWWWRGIVLHLMPGTPFRYDTSILWNEFLYPVRWLRSRLSKESSETKWVQWSGHQQMLQGLEPGSREASEDHFVRVGKDVES